MKGFGKGVKSFRDGMNDIESITKENPEKKVSEKESGIPSGRCLRRSQRQSYLDFLC
jgi:Sec-independent protein translocase protein TatA